MKPIVQYIRRYFSEIDKRNLISVSVFTTVLVYINYHFGLDNYIRKNNSFSVKLIEWYLVFLVAFSVPYFFTWLFKSYDYFFRLQQNNNLTTLVSTRSFDHLIFSIVFFLKKKIQVTKIYQSKISINLDYSFRNSISTEASLGLVVSIIIVDTVATAAVIVTPRTARTSPSNTTTQCRDANDIDSKDNVRATLLDTTKQRSST